MAEGVKIAHRLVQCGYRRQAVETVRTALAEDRLTATARTNLRRLLAWLETQPAPKHTNPTAAA